MNWLNGQQISWQSPHTLAAQFPSEDIALLYSGRQESGTGRYSFLCVKPIQICEGERWEQLPTFDTDAAAPTLPDWVGYLGYELGDHTPTSPATLDFPRFRLVRYAMLYQFDHETETLTQYTRTALTPPPVGGRLGGGLSNRQASAPLRPHPPLTSNLTRAAYEAAIRATVGQIHAGEFYQANITRKFSGQWAHAPESLALFTALTEASPAPYSAYIRHQGTAILSASPECFVQVTREGAITTRPIKGSARRGASETEDQHLREALTKSAKNHAENLMIVDLMRNDLAQASLPESVRVTEQSGLYSYATIHHLISTITAQKRPNASLTDVIRACFPPGSMTGAPKIAAMRWCGAQEQLARGVYSGAIGWFGADGSCDLSVVIRTLLIAGNRFEFQVGGGIVADSTPEDEWRETLTKARGILTALGLSEADIAGI